MTWSEPGRRCWATASAPSSGSPRCCCATAGSGGPGRTGRRHTSSGSPPSGPALGAALAHYRAALDTRRAELDAAGAELAGWAGREPLAPAVARLGCYRGIAGLTGLVLAVEVAGWRRFPSARAFMGFTGLVPAEYSSGDKTRRGSITKAGSGPARTALAGAAWTCQHKPAIGVALRRRQKDASPDTLARSWKAQRRLHGKYKAMTTRGKPAGMAVTAVARELAGFVWAEMTSWQKEPLRCHDPCGHDHARPDRSRPGRPGPARIQPVACRDARHSRNDPRAHYERQRDSRN